MYSSFSARDLALLTLGLTVVAPIVRIAPATAQTTFPDVPQNYWAQPFIESLTARNIIAGYPDGTFRPEQAVQRDEFAALVRKAFSTEQVREIPSASTFNDVPQGYWANPAIEEAYEQGFMQATENNNFLPEEEIERAEALVILMRGLNLVPAQTATAAPQTTPGQTTPATRRARRGSIPFAIASLMQPVFSAVSQVAPAQATPPETTTSSETQAAVSRPPSEIVSNYYTDAAQIPSNAVEEVAQATEANIVVNYPNVRVLNPTEPLSRASAAAWIHQALVRLGRIEPLTPNVEATNYIVGRSNTENQ
ncbi:S-layer homology domain-containing protein [Gloeocapsopsis crepidinum LEGE 06123]|uniref:S-layer homology domain-containing protein n=1 Tax=Gloeocapsopsis crepidinum LEGE 06123 TaxID=588587 RepID=A0ABR9UYS5_9CHRO|nr:S-layer homology domain-containing protein [Gloeocapsopsis crepidinum]MBE9193467.1 S-layer homology domain-containing protein [Gloeocapsopsis crepidinum LEGE 06123]